MSYVGYCSVELADHNLELLFPMFVFYPTSTPSKAEPAGPYSLDLAREAPLQPGLFPLVLLSHGSGGSPWVYRTLAHYLARHGFIVGLPEHPFNNRDNNTWADTLQNLEVRPRHLATAIHYFFDHPPFAGAIKSDAVGLIGHSMGGYTALALAGGVAALLPEHSPDGRIYQLPFHRERLLKALVLLAPATVWFQEVNSLVGVQTPTLLITAEKDLLAPAFHTRIILQGMADKQLLQHWEVPNAGHFCFLSPFPEAMTHPAFAPSQDPPSFNRAHFHNELLPVVRDFLAQHLL